jgi:transcriptional regulator with XRE-family HTH domain
VPPGITQKEFGRLYGIGSQSMVAQLLNGTRPLNYEAAAKFAKGLNCTIYDICPEMGDAIKENLLPVLGRALRRAAAVLMVLCAALASPPQADAGILSANAAPVYYVKWLWRRILAFIRGSCHIANLAST